MSQLHLQQIQAERLVKLIILVVCRMRWFPELSSQQNFQNISDQVHFNCNNSEGITAVFKSYRNYDGTFDGGRRVSQLTNSHVVCRVQNSSDECRSKEEEREAA